ncbi:MAG TPA: hypothetical protein VKW76_04115 [Candidatus Binatia bacterium]|nr:hypothetical protein [Candidatus Binatia bacterium]
MAGMVGALGIGTAQAGGAPCVAGPFADDGGSTTCNKAAEICEAKIGGLIAKAVGAVIKCHAKQEAAAFSTANGKPKTFDEETCESTAITAFTTAAQAAQTKAAGACSCVQVTTIAGLIGSVLDGSNSLAFCEGSTAIDPSGDDTGTFDPTDATGSKAMQKVGGCISKLVKGWEKCHATFAKGVLGGKLQTNDPGNTDEICEGDGDNSNPKGAIEQFNACLGKLTGVPACVTANVPSILGLTKTQLDGANGLVYCASPSGAFVQ